jgi:hypothetical protein
MLLPSNPLILELRCLIGETSLRLLRPSVVLESFVGPVDSLVFTALLFLGYLAFP